MKTYCKAYRLQELMQFPGWQEQHKKDGSTLPTDTFVYLWDDLTVVKSPIKARQEILFDKVTPEWSDFCQETLGFASPDDWDIDEELD
jgi:hypothetical protein